jgi:hypothetical protein
MNTQQLHFTKPSILVTRVGENNGNDSYHNPHQRYYQYDSMRLLFKAAAQFAGNETPVSALRVHDNDLNMREILDVAIDKFKDYRPRTADYFHNFTAALDEYKRGIRVDM